MTDTTQPLDLTNAFAEMHDAVAKVVQLFIANCPEGFAAGDVADAIVEVCSDELADLYRAQAERDRLRTQLAERTQLLVDERSERERLNAACDVRQRRIDLVLELLRGVSSSTHQDAVVLALDLMPLLDGPLHPDQLRVQGAEPADEWVRCSNPRCPHAERHAKAAERGWLAAPMGTWQCPSCRAATPPATN
jgi:hypothetical protein